MGLGSNIKKIREDLNIDIKDFSKTTGISIQTILKYESEELKTIPVNNMKKICLALNKTSNQLLADVSDKENVIDDTVNENAEGIKIKNIKIESENEIIVTEENITELYNKLDETAKGRLNKILIREVNKISNK